MKQHIKSLTVRLEQLLVFLFLTLSVSSFFGCSSLKKRATEGDSMLAVIVKGNHSAVVKPILETSLAKPVFTPQPEPRFILQYGGKDSLQMVSKWQNVLVLGALDADDEVTEWVTGLLSEDVLGNISQQGQSIIRRDDLWSSGQTVIFVVGSTRVKLASWLANNGEELYKMFADARYERMKKQIYSQYEREELADSLQEEHGWHLRIQHDYAVAASERSPHYIRLRRFLPDRFVTIAWKPGEQEEVSGKTLIEWRNQIGLTYADPSKLVDEYLQMKETTLNGMPAIQAYALWETIGPLGGGPSVLYLLHSGGTLYLLEGMVFAPDRDKEPFIRQLEVILNTFEPPQQ
ncbi:DUF4837 family protein [bacterium]|nr:DUF4837 family protein [bacterium]